MYTWISETGRVIEQVRVVREGDTARARGRIVSATHSDHNAFTLEYEADFASDQSLSRVQLKVTTADFERTVDLARDAEGFSQLDADSGERTHVGAASIQDVDITYSVFFASVIIRRLGLHAQPGVMVQRVLSVDSLTLDVSEDSVTFSSDNEKVHGITATASTSASVDSDGLIINVDGLSLRV